jgi:prepilin-type N-terminal cleavage/methylation domain-containing protein
MINYFKFSKKKLQGFTILELLVVLAVIGVFSAFAYPNISNWINDRNVKKEAYEVVTYLKERRDEVQSGKYGMVQVAMNWRIHTLIMTKENFFKEYKDVSTYSTYKANQTCGYRRPFSFVSDSSLNLELGSGNSSSNVNVYPSTSHPFPTSYSVICITRDATIRYDGSNVSETDNETNQKVDYFLLCSKSNSTMQTCKQGANLDYMYKITWDRFVNIKLYKYNKNKTPPWMKIDG